MKTYPKYKESGIPWIGQIPEEWNQVPLRYIIEITKGRKPISFVDEPIEEPYVTMDYLRDRENSCQYPSSTEGLVHINEDEILVLWDGANAGEFLKARQGYLSSTMAVIRVTDKNVLPNYLFLFLKSGEKYSKTLASGTTIPHFNPQYFDINIPVPPLQEQQAIADYLDKKTGDIDELVGLLNKQIADVRAYRQSLITETVTQGLNKDVPMKDSGIEWIGQIPEGWKVMKFNNLIDVLTDYTANGSFGDLAANVEYLNEPNYSRLIRLTDLRNNLQNENGIWVSEYSHNYLAKSALYGGELLMANVGAYSGLVCLMPKINFPATLGPNMFLIKNTKSIETKYLYHLLASNLYFSKLQIIATSSAQPKLNKDNIRQLSIVFPPLSEQQQIVEFLDAKTKDIDELLSKLEAQVADLLAYKSSLISEAVTGKMYIDPQDNLTMVTA